jgi:hypothetical protein
MIVVVAFCGGCGLLGVIGQALGVDSEGSPRASSPKSSQNKEESVTLANFQKLEMGMTYEEVSAILGKEGVEESRNKFGELETILYSWDADGFLKGSVTGVFQNGELTQKSQAFLD